MSMKVNKRSKLAIILLVITIIFSAMSTSVFATSSNSISENITNDNIIIDENTGEALILIDSKVTVTYEYTLIERNYKSLPSLRGASGSGTFKNEKEHYFSADAVRIKFWVSGNFSWNSDNNTATVSNVQKGFSGASESRVSNSSLTSGNNQGGIWPGKKYAYAKWTFTYQKRWEPENFSVYIDVNVDGISSRT